MYPIDQNKVKIKNLIGILENPTLYDLLYEIVSFLDAEGRHDSEFKTHEAFLKTRVRFSSLLSEDLDKLVEMGYLEKLKHANYRVIKHLWEKTI
jgi:hypothetical protein